ncbi:uncharacterized protein B0H18DRAFT_955935 [Fomitopsis serialis]|uniref:uncharacterized protein n=1 Tax=Fomitopsis serialis TaxID=139415 RepID=UPI00200732C0|nr:uncharacterized protein B0H18DRAFT_955935 [Neoantrodia serialis]KAH9923238.1 hypothetical protein B0H18DRAFT_955935 [Neoantrodia serialis]
MDPRLVPLRPDGALPTRELDLSGERIVLSCEALDPSTLPGDGCYLEVWARIRRTKVEGEGAYLTIWTEATDEFKPLPFDDPDSDDEEEDAVRQAREEARGGLFSLPELLQQLSVTQGGPSEASVNTDAENAQVQGNSDRDGPDGDAATVHASTDKEKGAGDRDPQANSGGNGPDDDAATAHTSTDKEKDAGDLFWDKLRASATSYLLAHPSQFEDAKEVYIVRVPYVAGGYWAVRLFVISGNSKTFVTSPPLALLPHA